MRTEVGLIEETAERTWAAIERARAEAALRESEAALRESDAKKDEFLAMLSHELRNPLAPIMNGLYILEHTPAGSKDAATAQAIMRRQVGQLARLVDDLLDLTRIARGKIQLKGDHVELNQLVERTVDDHRSLFEKNDIELEVQLALRSVHVNGDSNRLAQVIGNLLQNSAKFTGKGGRTRVALSAADDGEVATVTIADSGVGMSDEVLSRLFQPFMQGEVTIHRSQGGLGLGLALTKRLVELHGGTIRAHSAGLGRGAEFIISLPVDSGRAGHTEPPLSSRGRSQRRVLIIEDNRDAADTLRAGLELCGHVVEVANDGDQGLSKAREFVPEIVLCDLGLPGTNGYQVAQVLREDPKLNGAYLVALSGYAMPEDRERAQQAGFDRHLAKPPDLAYIDALLSEVRLPRKR